MRSFRIFLAIGGQASPIDNNKVWLRNLYDPLVTLGHDVFLLDIDDLSKGKGFKNMSQEAKEMLSNELPLIFKAENERKPFDIFLSYLHNGQIFPEVLKEIKKNVYTINYTTNFHQFDMYREIASIVDYNIYISKIAKGSFDELAVKSYWMPFAANPSFYKPTGNKNNNCVFIGSAYGPRPYLFWRLLQYGVNLNLYGLRWKIEGDYNKPQKRNLTSRFKKSINEFLSFAVDHKLSKVYHSFEDELRDNYFRMNQVILALLKRDYAQHLHSTLNDNEYVKTIAEAAIIVNIQESRFNHDYFNHRVLFGSNLRDFEATMSGTFLCTQFSEEINELFEIGKEIICYHNEHDLAENLKYYSNHVTEREKIAFAGYQRSLKQHTWESRFTEFFKHLNL